MNRPGILAFILCAVVVPSCLGIVPFAVALPRSSVGVQKTIIILVEFSDTRHTSDSREIARTIFDEMSLYFRDQSNNLTWFVGNTTSKWYQLPGPIDTYAVWPHRLGPIHWERAEPFILQSLRLADPEVDFRDYQRIVIVHSGSGGSRSMDFGMSFYWWPLSISTNDGTTVTDLIVLGEYEAFSVVCHEFLHFLGGYAGGRPAVPDLYDMDSLERNQFAGIYVGSWDLMSIQIAEQPQGLLAWTKLRLRWLPRSQVTSVGLGESATLKIDALEVTSSGLKAISIPLPSGKYYLVEVRQKMGYDAKLPDSGVLVALCDDRVQSGEGPVRVQDANPNTSTLDDAAFDLRSGKAIGFFDKSNNVAVVITGKSGLSYSIFVGTASQGESALVRSERLLAATVAMDAANASIRTALILEKTEGIDNAKSLLSDASDAFQKGDYDTALTLAEKAKVAADSATYPRDYYEAKDLLLKATDLRSRASTSNFTSPEAQSLIQRAESAYSLAEAAFLENDYAAATHHAQTAILLFEEALSVEQNYPASLEAQQRQAFNYALIGVVSGITLAVLAIYTARKRTKKSRPRAT